MRNLAPLWKRVPYFNSLLRSPIHQYSMKLTIITPDKLAFEGPVTAVTVPGSAGSFQILKDHAAIVSTLEDGQVIIKHNQDEQIIIIKGGVVEVKENNIIILAEGIAQE